MKKILLLVFLINISLSEIYSQDTVYIIKETIREAVKEKRVKERAGKDVIPEKQNQISLGAGWVPYFQNHNNIYRDYFGSFSFGYTRHINERYSTGFNLTYLRAPEYFYNIDLYINNFSRHFFQYTGHFNLNYYNKKNMTLYFGAEVGLLTILDIKDYSDYGSDVVRKRNRTVPVADFTAFGIRMRNKVVSPFFEVGFGLRGIFRGGVNFRF